MHKKT